MTRSARLRAFAVLLVGVIAIGASCTLLLPTQDLIKDCKAADECDDGFECKDNACLPVDEAVSG